MKKIIRNKNKNSWKDKFNFFLENNSRKLTKGELIKIAYSETEAKNVDSAIPISLWNTVDNTSFYVFDYNGDSAFGKLVDLRERLKFHGHCEVWIMVNGETLRGEDLPTELDAPVTFHTALDYVFYNDNVEMFIIRPISGKSYAKGGKVAYDYIPKRDIESLQVTLNGELENIAPKDILSGAYIKKLKNNSSSSELITRIMNYAISVNEKEAKSHKAFVKKSDIEYFQKYLTDNMIMAFYCGVKSVIEFDCDCEAYELGGIFQLRTDGDYIKNLIKKAKNKCANKTYELGLKYPDVDFGFLGKAQTIKKIISKPNKFGEHTSSKVWIFDNLVAGKTLGKTDEKGKYTDYNNGIKFDEIELKFDYLGFVSSNPERLFTIIKNIAKQKNGYVKNIEFLVNGLGGVGEQDILGSDIKYKKGGLLGNKPIIEIQKGFSYSIGGL